MTLADILMANWEQLDAGVWLGHCAHSKCYDATAWIKTHNPGANAWQVWQLAL